MLCVILSAGLFPFTSHPKNEVAWRQGGSGLHFGDYGSIHSAGDFLLPASPECCSIEVWLSPGATFDTNTIVCFFSPNNPCYFSLRQQADDFVVVDRNSRPRSASVMDINHVFRKGDPVLLTVVSGTTGTAVYANARPLRQSTENFLSGHPLRSMLIVGDSSREGDSWSGEMRGIAIYESQLTPREVLEHYEHWQTNSMNSVSPQKLLGLYLFKEGVGDIVHNLAGAPEPDLFVPPYYVVFDQRLLKPFWQEFYPSWGYVRDLAINIAGFVPLGFFFGAWFLSKQLRRPVLKTVVFGFLVSLLIELLQSRIPMRQSGTTDLITNTAGAAIGASFSGLNLVTRTFRRIGLIPEPQHERS